MKYLSITFIVILIVIFFSFSLQWVVPALDVQVVDFRGKPLEGVDVFVKRDEVLLKVGSTGEDGGVVYKGSRAIKIHLFGDAVIKGTFTFFKKGFGKKTIRWMYCCGDMQQKKLLHKINKADKIVLTRDNTE